MWKDGLCLAQLGLAGADGEDWPRACEVGAAAAEFGTVEYGLREPFGGKQGPWWLLWTTVRESTETR